MKKTLFTISAAIFSIALSAQSQRLVLAEEFTQASCGPCASQNPAFNTLLAANTTKVVSVKYQTDWPGVDPMNAQNPATVSNRVTYYGVTGVPNVEMDGNIVVGAPNAITQSNINAEYAVPSPFTMNLAHYFNAAQDSIFIKCEIICSQNNTIGTGKLRVALVEEQISFTTPPGSNGELDFYNVMRKMYPNANGTSLTSSWTVNQTQIITFAESIPNYIYDFNELAVVAWIQDDVNKNVKQAAFSQTASSPFQLPPVASFASDVVTSCDGIVSFSDNSSLFPTQWLWNFGDNTTSTLQNPVHTYMTGGVYTVTLNATNQYGTNQIVRTNYVNVQLSGTAPTGTGDLICGPAIANVSATPAGNGSLVWLNSAGTQVATGNTYAPLVSGTTTYYAREMFPNTQSTVGAADNTIAAGAYFTANNVHGLYFNVLTPCVLNSFTVYANTAGNRTINVLDVNGNIICTGTFNLPAGQSVVNPNFQLPAGTGFLIKVASTTVDLYRNAGGATFPYTTSELVITGNTAAGNPTYYYYFYDWKVTKNPCASPATPVTVVDSCFFLSPGADLSMVQDVKVYPNPNNGQFTVGFVSPAADNYVVEITNMLGQVIYSEELNNFSGTYNKELNLTAEDKAVYFLRIAGSTGQTVTKIITQ